MRTRLCAALALLLAAGCARGPQALPTAPSGGVTATATMHLVIPLANAPASRRPAYISTQTQSIGLTVVSTTTSITALNSTFNVTPGSAGCTTGTTTITCTESYALGPDSYQATITAYSSTAGGGSVLSKATNVAFTVQLGVANAIPFTLLGLPNSVAFAQSVLSAPADGAMHHLTLTLSSTDASGNTIVPPGNYNTPISLSISGDPNGALSLSTSTIAAPANASGTTSVTVTYDASKSLTSATITATSGSATTAVNVNPLVYTPTSSHAMYVGQTIDPTVTVSEAHYSGAFTIAGLSSTATTSCVPVSCAPSSAGGSVVITLSPSAIGQATMTVTDTAGTQASVSVGVGGLKTYTTSQSGLTITGIALDSSGNIWLAGRGTLYDFNPNTCTTSCALTSTSLGTETASDVILGPDGKMWAVGSKVEQLTGCSPCTITTYAPPTALYQAAIGADGNIWATSQFLTSVDRITTSGTITSFTATPSPTNFITASPSGVLYYTIEGAPDGASHLDAFTPSSCSSTCTISTNSAPAGNGITSAPNGLIWYVSGTYLTEISPAGCTSACTATTYTFTAVSGVNGSPITAAGSYLWTNDVSHSPNVLYRIDPSSCSTTTSTCTSISFALPSGVSGVYKMAVDSSGNIWAGTTSDIVEMVAP